MPDLIPGSGFEELLSQVAVPESNIINSSTFSTSVNPQSVFENEFRKSMEVGQDFRTPDFVSPFQIDPSKRYPLQVINMDNEDIYAQGQSTISKAFNATVKGLGLAATTFTQSTLGLVNGVFQAVSDGKFSSFYDNDLNRWLDEKNKNLENVLPNYYSAAERNSPWYSNIFTANFIFDKIVKNLGFMAGAAGAGTVFARMLQVAKMGATGNLLKGLQATEKAVLEGKTLDTIGDTASGFNSFVQGYNALNTGQKALVAGLSTIGEAGIEALQTSDQARTKLLEEFRIQNGREAQGDELQRINDAASNIGNSTFALNTVLLTASNYIQFPKLLASSNRAERGMYHDLVQRANNVGFDRKTLAYVTKAPTNKFAKLFKTVRPYGPSVTEGLEEGLQFAVQTGTENFWHKKYQTGEDLNLGFLDGASSLLGQKATDDLFSYGLDKAFLSEEGQESFVVGALSGALGKARGTAREQRTSKAYNQAFLEQSNKHNLSSYTKDTFASVNRATVLANEMEDAVRQGDVLEFKDRERDFLYNYVYPKVKHGRMDLLHDELSSYRQQAATEEGFKQLQEQGKALPTDTRDAYLQRLNNIERISNSIETAYHTLNTRNAFLTKTDALGNTVSRYSDVVTQKMIYANAKIMDYDERIPQLSTNLIAAGINVDELLNDNSKFDEYSKLIDNLVTLGGQSVTEDTRVDLQTDLKDIVELSLRRKQFIEEYNAMKNAPDNYGETAPSTETIKITTKDGEEDIEIGTEYYLGKIVGETEEGFLSEKYPILTVLAKNTDGSLRIRDGNGNISTISSDELKGYKLGKVSDVRNNPKANYFMKNRNRIFTYKFKDGKREGVLRWSPNKDELFFEYKKNGKTLRVPVSNADFSYSRAKAKGFREPLIVATGATLTDIQEADDLGEKEDKLNTKLAKRLSLITNLVTSSRNRLASMDKFIADKKQELKNTEDELDKLTKTKAGVPRRKYTKAITKALQELGETKGRLVNEINNLTDEKEELEAIIPYYEDLLVNARELPEDTLELVKELKSEIDSLEEIIDNTNQAITTGNDLIQRIDTALQTAYKLLNDYIQRLKEENPNVPLSVDQYQERLERYLGEVGAQEFINNNEGYTPLIKSILSDIQEFSEELEITPNESRINTLQEQIKNLQEGLDEVITEQLAKSRILEFFEEKIKEERARQAEEAAMLKNKELQAKIFSSQKQLEALLGDNNGSFTEEENNKQIQEIQNADTNRKKSAQVLFSSTSDRSETNVPDNVASTSTIRARNFLFNQTHFSPSVKQNMKGLVVTLNNEKSLGLDGLVFSIARQNTSEGWNNLSDEELTLVVTDPDNGVALLVYAVERDGEYTFLDENGKELETPSSDNVVVSTLTSTATNWRNGESRVRSQDKDVADEIASQWRVKREQFMNSTQPQVFDLSFSRGLPIYNEIDGKITSTKLEGTLFPASEMEDIADTQGAIKVITTENYTHQDIDYKTIPGRVYFEYQDIFVPLSNRQFNKEEQEVIYNVLVQLAIQARDKQTFKGEYINYLQNVLFWGTPKDAPGRNQIWVDEDFALNFGNSGQSIPFTPTSIEQSQALIKAYLSGTYNNVNNFTLSNNFHDVFLEYRMEKGELVTKEHKNYQHFLLENSMVETPIAPKNSVPSNGNRNFMQKYAILQGVEYSIAQKEETKKPVIIPSSDRKTQLQDLKKRVESTKELTPIMEEIFVIIDEKKYEKFQESISEEELTNHFKKAGIVSVNNDTELANLVSKYLLPKFIDAEIASLPKSSTPKKEVATSGEMTATTKAGETVYFTAIRNQEGEIQVDIVEGKGDTQAIQARLEAAGKTPEQASEQILLLALTKAKAELEKAEPEIQEPAAQITPPTSGLSAPVDDNTEYRAITSFSVDRMSEEELTDFQSFMKANLPQFTIRELEHMITMAPDRKAWGKLQGDVISLYKFAEKGTGYHEAFEGVWKYFVLPEEQEEVLAEFKNRQGTFNDRVTNQTISYSEANDKQAKEELADEFARYKAGQKLTLGQKIRKFFDNIISFFRLFNRGYKPNTELRDKLFDKIEQGEFKTKKLPVALDINPEFAAVRNLSEAQTHAFVQDLTKRVFIQLLKDKVDLFDPENYEKADVYNTIKSEYSASISSLPNGEQTFNELWDRAKEYLKTFQIQFDENNNITINDENQTKNDYVNDKMTVDVKKSSPFAIKYLLASMAKVKDVDTTGKITFNREGIVPGAYQLLPFAKTFITILETVESSTSLDNMISKLKGLSKTNNNFVPLLNMLGKKGENIDWNNLTINQWRLLAGFYNTFNKQKPDATFLTYSDRGEVYFSSAEIGRASEGIKRQWEDNIRFTAREGKNLFIGYNQKNKNYEVNNKLLKELQKGINDPNKKIEFLDRLGIKFDKESYNKLDKDQRDTFSNSVGAIIEFISQNKGLKIVSGKSLGISGPLTQLSELFAKTNNFQSESTFINGDGEQQQTYVQPNYLSTLSNVFNQVYSINELYKQLPYLKNDPYAQGSEILRLGGKFFKTNGNRTDVKLVVGYPDSIKEENRGKKIADLDYHQRLSAQINNTLKGVYYIGVPADSSTEWTLELGEFIDFGRASSEGLFEKATEDLMFKYLQSELALARDHTNHSNLSNIGDKAKDLRFFKDILSPANLQKINKLVNNTQPLEITESIKTDIRNYIKSEVKTLRETLLYNQELTPTENGKFSFPNLIDSFAKSKKFNKEALTQQETDALLRYVVANNIIANTEMHKIIFGDPYSFAIKDKGGKIILDETKRIKSLLSPAASTLVSEAYNNTFNKEFNTVGNTVLTKDIPGFYRVRNTVNSVTFSDVITQSQYVEQFSKNNEADAQALHSLQMHRDLLQRHGQWSKKAEDWYKWEMAFARQELFKKGKFTNYPEALQTNDKGRISRAKPEYTLHIIKPIVRGVKHNSAYLDPVLDKFSSAPLFYSAIKDTHLEDLFVKMMKEDIDYVIFESGRKVGAEGKNNFYKQQRVLNGKEITEGQYNKLSISEKQKVSSYQTGEFNNSAYTGEITINWKDYSVQVENAYDKGKTQTRGSQITKLFSLDFFTGGVPIDFTGKIWSTLSETEKEQQSDVYKEVKWNNTLLGEMTKVGYESLIDRLGLVDNGERFIITDYKKLYKTLEEESLKRDIPENIKKIFRINPETGKPYVPLEATSEYTKIQKMLYSMVDSSILSPKVNGGPKVQLSVFGWESKSAGRSLVIKDKDGFRKITKEEFNSLSDAQKKNVRLTSDTLKFYTKEDPYIEVMLPHWFKDKFKKAGFTSDEELLNYLKDSDILKGIGFRIPTSNMTAIEAIRVKGFLPQEFGDTIVLPTEITTKAGSDFDIDKLNTYLKNVYLDGKKKLQIVPFLGLDSIDKFKELLVKEDIESIFEVESLYEEESAPTKDYDELAQIMYKQSLENEYFRSLERMITNPLNFDRLTEPTDNDTLASLAADIAEAMGTTESNKLTRLLSIDYLSKLRHAFLAGKKWVGIGAVNNTGHSQAQRANQYIDITNTELSQSNRDILGDGNIVLPHNKDIQGRSTLSGSQDKQKNFISSKLGWYLTAFVDIAKDPYILNIIFSRKMVGTFLFLERLGISTQTLGYFMNQPIIREYIHYTDIQGVNRVASHYYRDKFLEGNQDFLGQASEKINVSNDKLRQNIVDFKNKKTSQDWKNQQRAILDEFIKYTKMAEFLFMSNQSTNWDTARFSTGAAVRKKELLLQKQRTQNIIKSPDDILNISNNGKIKDAMILSKEAIDTLSTISSPSIREELDVVLDKYLNLSYLPEKLLEKIDTQIVNSFIDYLVQTKINLNGSIKYLVSDATTSIVARISAMQTQFQSNPIFQSLRTNSSNRTDDADNIRIAPFPKEVYDKNLITGYLSELRELDLKPDGTIKPNSLYGDLVKLAILQGTGSQFNLLSYIPIQDTSQILSSVIGSVTKEDAKNFASNFNFEKNQWKNTDVVLPLQPIYPKYKFPTKFGPKVLRLSDLFDNKSGITERPLITLERYQKMTKTGDRYDITTGNRIPFQTIKSMITSFDFSFSDKVGYQKVFIPGTNIPLTKQDTTEDGKTHTYYFYKQVNLLGSNGIQEHYTTQQPSVLDNGTVKVDPLDDQLIVDAVLNPRSPRAPGGSPAPQVIGLTTNFSRNSVEQDPNYIYLFTDNAQRTSGNNPIKKGGMYATVYNENAKYPGTTQAVIRGLDNAYPITTMVDDKRTQWADNRFEEYKGIIDLEVDHILNDVKQGFLGIKFSAQAPFGQGQISNMKAAAPRIWNYLNQKLKEIGINNEGPKPTVIPNTSLLQIDSFEEFKKDLKTKNCN